MLLACLSLVLLTGCSQKSKLKLAIELADKQCPMDMGTVGEISGITFDGTDVIYNMLMNEDYLDLNALEKNPDAMKSAVTAMFKNPKGEIKTMLEMVVDTKSGIKFIYKGKTTGKEVECYLGTEDLNNILNQNLTEEESDKHKLEELVNVTNVSCPMDVDEATTLDKLTIESDKVVYNYTIDEAKVDMATMRNNEAQMKQAIKGSLNVSESSLRLFLEACVKDNKGLSYRYVGGTSGESAEYIFTVAELKALL
ncbi:hypothetical protein [Bacteroides clarus]|nr:hypothetical protein [Bacteroides clarus]